MNDYYKKQKCETIDLIEEIVTRDSLPRNIAYNVAQAQKYISRAGIKTQDYKTDLYKALDYLHRAVTNIWYHDIEEG